MEVLVIINQDKEQKEVGVVVQDLLEMMLKYPVVEVIKQEKKEAMV